MTHKCKKKKKTDSPLEYSKHNILPSLALQDQKILELMLAKREEEKAAEGRRQAARRAWETEKQHEDAVRTTTEVRRRESLARQRQREKDLQKVRTGTSRSLYGEGYEGRGNIVYCRYRTLKLVQI